MFSIDDILAATGGRLIDGPSRGKVKCVSIDSRTAAKGQLFIAVKGDIFDGHDFVADVVKKDVRVIVVHKAVNAAVEGVSVILVGDTTRALGALARFHRLRFKIPVIAITGSAGKTTTKEMAAAVLGRTHAVLKNEGTQNNHIGVPLTLLKLKPAHDLVVLECGTNQPGDIVWLADIARPDTAVFTNVGESHLEKLKSKAGVLKEKWKLTAFMRRGTVILNADDPLLIRQKTMVPPGIKVITYGIDADADVKARAAAIQDGRRFQFAVKGQPFELNSCGRGNISNALAAYACGRLYKVPVADIAAALKKFQFPQGRGQILKLGSGWLINDAYNANPVSMRGALQTLRALTVAGKKIVVAADMLELGSSAEVLHKDVGRAAAQSAVDVLITVGTLAKSMADEASRRNKGMRVFAFDDAGQAQQCLAGVFNNGDAVLVKGSRRMKMEHVVEFLLASPAAGLT